MVFRKIDNGSKKIAAKLYLRGRDTVPEITDLCDISRSTLLRYVPLYEATGDVTKPKSYLQGRPRSLTREDVEYIQELTRAQPTLYLREIREALQENRLIDVDISTIHNTLERENISYKKLHSTASERDADIRADFQIRMADYHTPQLVFCDETASDERSYFRLYGRAPRNQRAISASPFIRGDRYSLLPAMSIDGIFAADIVKGSYSRDRFIRFLEEDMLPMCNPFPGERSVIVMDNCRIHHGPEIRRMIEDEGCRLEFLPPYSPDLNPIELAFSAVKGNLQANGALYRSYENPYWPLHEAYSMVGPEMAQNFFSHCGYW